MSEAALPEDSAEELYEHAPCGYLSTRPDGTIVRVNATFLDWTGYAREDLVGRRRLQDLLTAGGRIFHETHIGPLLQMQGAVRELALELACPQGTLPVLLNAVVKTDEDGTPVLVRVTVLDATERRSYERELLAARKAERAARERTERLQRVTAALSSALDARRVAAVVVDELVAGLRADRALVAAVTEDEPDGEPQSVGFHGPGFDVPPVAEPHFEEDRAVTGREPRSLAVLPLEARGRSIGVLALGFMVPRAFSPEDRAFLGAVAAQCAQALDRALLHDATAVAARRSGLLARAGRAIDELRSVEERARRAIELVVPELADAALLELEVEGTRRRRWAVGDDALLAESAGDDEGRRAVLPLRARGRAVGTLVLARDGGRPYRAGEQPFLADLADRVGLALENARLADQERDVAHVLQRSLLTDALPYDARLAIETFYQPAVAGLEVGGDWYDAFFVGDDRVALVVGDVVGRGVRAASAMGQLRSATRALASAGLGPAALLERLDAFVEDLPPARMATLAYAELDLGTGALRLACAGHPPPLRIRGDEHRFLWDGRSAPLGAYLGRRERMQCEERLATGDRLLLYTDGLVERRDRSIDEGLDALVGVLRAAGDAPLRRLTRLVVDGLLPGAPADDVCMLFLGFGVTTEFERHLPADPQALAPLRADLRTWLAGNDVPPDDRDAVVLACGEAVANSIEHAYGGDRDGVVAVEGRLDDGQVELRVADEGAWRPPHALPHRGRGMRIIGCLMDDVWVDRGGGTTVRMRLGLGGR